MELGPDTHFGVIPCEYNEELNFDDGVLLLILN